jgi:DNA-binding NarL/FixJ family response regulator
LLRNRNAKTLALPISDETAARKAPQWLKFATQGTRAIPVEKASLILNPLQTNATFGIDVSRPLLAPNLLPRTVVGRWRYNITMGMHEAIPTLGLRMVYLHAQHLSMQSQFRVLVVDDYVPWREFLCSKLREQPEFLIVGEVADGSEAVHKAQEIQPDLILMDIGLPKLNGFEAARQIRKLLPTSTILFVSEQRSLENVQEAFRIGALGYVVKSDAAGDLAPAIRSVLEGKPFVSTSVISYTTCGEIADPRERQEHQHPHHAG